MENGVQAPHLTKVGIVSQRNVGDPRCPVLLTAAALPHRQPWGWGTPRVSGGPPGDPLLPLTEWLPGTPTPSQMVSGAPAATAQRHFPTDP